MSESPQIIPLGSLADAAATGSQLALEEQQVSATQSEIDIGTTTGYVPPEPDNGWP